MPSSLSCYREIKWYLMQIAIHSSAGTVYTPHGPILWYRSLHVFHAAESVSHSCLPLLHYRGTIMDHVHMSVVSRAWRTEQNRRIYLTANIKRGCPQLLLLTSSWEEESGRCETLLCFSYHEGNLLRMNSSVRIASYNFCSYSPTHTVIHLKSQWKLHVPPTLI